MAKRKSMSNALRFEVFKRDLFTCQYCGRKAPEVILEVDHIKPVSKGGDNSIENLVAACYDCNRGKGAKKLSDLSAVEKSRRQLEEMQERKNMVDMIFQWKESLHNQYDDSAERIMKIFYDATNFSFTDDYLKRVKASIKKFGLDIMIDAMYIGIDSYYDGTEESAKRLAKAYIGIASNKYDMENNPKKSSITYIKNTFKRNCGYFDQKYFYTNFPSWYELEDKEEFLNIARTTNSLNEFFRLIRAYGVQNNKEVNNG